ncbi:MAG: carbohydrate-binding protein [Methanospirillum sp.]
MHHISFVRRRNRALAPAAALLLALCLLAVGVQAMTDPMDTAALVADPSLSAVGGGDPSAPAGYETPIVVDAAEQVDPAIDGTRIIWQDWRNDAWTDAEGDIYSYDLASHLELPEGASTQSGTKIVPNDYDPAISDAGIFWVFAGFSDATIQNTIKGRTLAGEPINVTTLGDPSYSPVSDLAVDGDSLVYVLDEYSLIAYDTTTGESRTIRQNADGLLVPDVSGGSIVWQEKNGPDWNIYWYNPAGGSVRALANASGDQVTPAIDGTRVVWADNRSGDWDLYTADLAQPDPVGVPWLVAPGDQTNPQLSGDRVVWRDNRNGDWKIWLGSLSGGAIGPVSSASGDQEAPAVDGDRIVWQDMRNGNWDIYMFTVSSTAPAPVPTPAPLVITAPGTYSIAADGYDGNATPIEIRSSNVVLDGGGHIVDGTDRPGSCGIRIVGPLSNVAVRNVRLTNWETGIRADAVTDSVIETSGISHNHRGIVLDAVQNVRVRNCTITANDDRGVAVQDSANTTVHANDVRRTGDGFTHYFSFIDDLSTHAISVDGSAGTEISGNDLGGEHGSLEIGGSRSTRVTGNQLTGRLAGIFSLSSGEDMLVFDNVFRSGHDVVFSVNATWNTTRSPGPNIVGGPEIGGNFWANLEGTGFSETHPDTNRDGFCDDANPNGDALPLAPWNGPAPGPTPFTPLSIPGRIQAEDYNLGGEGVAYHDTTPGNTGGAYRHDDVDIETGNGITDVGWVRNGEYLTYTANVTRAGTYTISARVASPNIGRLVAITVDGAQERQVEVPNTGSFDQYRNVTARSYTSGGSVTPGPTVTTAPLDYWVALSAGNHTVKLAFTGDGQNVDWIAFEPYVPPTPTPTPVGPQPYKPLAIPGTIQAEDYNLGGEGVAYHDTTPGNEGGAYRHDDVDIETVGDITNVGWIRNGEFLTYTANVSQNGTYAMTARVASPNAGRRMSVAVAGGETTSIMVPNTGSFAKFTNVTAPINLTAGTRTLVLTFFGDGQNLDWFELSPYVPPTPTPTVSPQPYMLTHVPGRIQAENYDLGGEGVAYHDTTPGNTGGMYRHDDVDIEAAGGIVNVGWIRNGEFLIYTTNVVTAGTYLLSARVASPNSGRTFAVSVDGTPLATIAVPNTGAYERWTATAPIPVALAAGNHTLKLAFSGDGQNLDYVSFDPSTPPTVTATPTPTPEAGGANFTAAPVSAPMGSAVRFTLTPAAGKTVSTAWWSFDAAAHLNTWNSNALNPTFFYPAAGTFSPLVKIVYADGTTETVQRTGYIRAT